MSAWLDPPRLYFLASRLDPGATVAVALLAVLALIPVYVALTGNTYALTLFTRVLILALAAVSLNLIMGYGGMVSFGHAAYLGIGGYAVGILWKEGFSSGFVQWPVAIGLERYGGDDGMTIRQRSQFGGLIDLDNKTVFYYVCFALLVGSIYLISLLVNSRFGLVIQGSRSNDRRMRAVGFPTFRYKLACFVIAGALCGLAGALLANHTNFISPATMFWTRSGDFMVMVVLGGLGTAFGPLIGTVTFLLLEEALSRVTEYSGLVLGPLLLLVAIFLHGGIESLFAGWRQEKAL